MRFDGKAKIPQYSVFVCFKYFDRTFANSVTKHLTEAGTIGAGN